MARVSVWFDVGFAAARRAGQLLFGTFPVEFALDVCCVTSYTDAS